MGRDVLKSDKRDDEMSEFGNNTADEIENPTSVLKGMSDIGQSMRLMEVIEDGSKLQIVLEDVSMEDVEAIHAYQLAQGSGTLTVSDRIRYEA